MIQKIKIIKLKIKLTEIVSYVKLYDIYSKGADIVFFNLRRHNHSLHY